MPYSELTHRPWVLAELVARGLSSFTHIVDVGAGAGQLRDCFGIGTPKAKWTAVEIWEPYVAQFGLLARYDEVIVSDVRTLDPLPDADLYIFGDVMEHMYPDEAVAVWERARRASRWLVIGLPVLEYIQGAEFGNVHETHLYQWSMEEVLERFAGIEASIGVPPGEVSGAFIARGERE